MAFQREASEALFKAIKDAAEQSDLETRGPAVKAQILRDLALAYRYAAGGAQPGSVNVESR